jgi:hypothetical protein
MTIDRNHERRVRRLARRFGYAVLKSRQRNHVPNSDNHGHFMLVNPYRNTVVLGERFDARLEDIEAFFETPAEVQAAA